MKVVILTGGSGYIGKAITDVMCRAGYRVFNIDLNDPKILESKYGNKYVWFDEDLRYGLEHTNLHTRIRKFLKGDSILGIFHLAAYKDLTESIFNPFDYYDNNLKSTLHMLELAKYFSIKNIIYSSSAAVYSDDAVGAVVESFPTTPEDAYGYSKLICEKIIMDVASDMQSNAICLRYQNPIGCIPGVTVDESESMFGNILRSIKLRITFNIFGGDYPTADGTCIRDYVDIRDLAEVHKFIIELGLVDVQDVFNFGTGKGVSCLEACKEVRSMNPEFEFKIIDRRPGDAAGSYADTTKLAELGYTTKYSLRETIDLILTEAGFHGPNAKSPSM